MKILDPLYGAFELPRYLEYLVETPEFRRLSEVRLLNINSVSLAALADVRRYSHTLGVLCLALRNPLLGYGEDEHKALLAAIIIHDAGTPAFAHLFEYFLNDRADWSHEQVLSSILNKTAHRDGKFQQFFQYQVPGFEAACRKAKISYDLVGQIVDGRHPLSRLVFGSLDFDNIDNVYRMALMLGLKPNIQSGLTLAGNIGVAASGDVTLERKFESEVNEWRRLRRAVYEILVFDAKTVAGQAVLSKVISDALSASEVSEEDWGLTDSALIDAICRTSPAGKARLERDFFGRLPQLCLIAQTTGLDGGLWELTRDALARRIETFLASEYPLNGLYGYALRDSGTFEKALTFQSPSGSSIWSSGMKSRSLVLYGFTRSARLKVSPEELGRQFLSSVGDHG